MERVKHFVPRETLAVRIATAEARAKRTGSRIYVSTKGALCSKCHRVPPLPGQRYCAECHAAAMRESRARLKTKHEIMRARLAAYEGARR